MESWDPQMGMQQQQIVFCQGGQQIEQQPQQQMGMMQNSQQGNMVWMPVGPMGMQNGNGGNDGNVVYMPQVIVVDTSSGGQFWDGGQGPQGPQGPQVDGGFVSMQQPGFVPMQEQWGGVQEQQLLPQSLEWHPQEQQMSPGFPGLEQQQIVGNPCGDFPGFENGLPANVPGTTGHVEKPRAGAFAIRDPSTGAAVVPEADQRQQMFMPAVFAQPFVPDQAGQPFVIDQPSQLAAFASAKPFVPLSPSVDPFVPAGFAGMPQHQQGPFVPAEQMQQEQMQFEQLEQRHDMQLMSSLSSTALPFMPSGQAPISTQAQAPQPSPATLKKQKLLAAAQERLQMTSFKTVSPAAKVQSRATTFSALSLEARSRPNSSYASNWQPQLRQEKLQGPPERLATAPKASAASESRSAGDALWDSAPASSDASWDARRQRKAAAQAADWRAPVAKAAMAEYSARTDHRAAEKRLDVDSKRGARAEKVEKKKEEDEKVIDTSDWPSLAGPPRTPKGAIKKTALTIPEEKDAGWGPKKMEAANEEAAEERQVFSPKAFSVKAPRASEVKILSRSDSNAGASDAPANALGKAAAFDKSSLASKKSRVSEDVGEIRGPPNAAGDEEAEQEVRPDFKGTRLMEDSPKPSEPSSEQHTRTPSDSEGAGASASDGQSGEQSDAEEAFEAVRSNDDALDAEPPRCEGFRSFFAYRFVAKEVPEELATLGSAEHETAWRDQPPIMRSRTAPMPINTETPRDGHDRGAKIGKDKKKSKSSDALEGPAPTLTPSATAWKRRSNSNAEVGRKEELRKEVNSLLNKVCPENVSTIIEKVASVEVRNPEELELVICLIFKKALAEPHYCETYADMVFALKQRMPEFPPSEEGAKPVTFKATLLTICQHEFESLASVLIISAEDLEGMDPEEIAFQKGKRKGRVLANMKFIGQLFLRQVLNAKIIGSVIQDLTMCDQADVLPEEPMIECMCELLTNIGHTLESSSLGKHSLTTVCGRLLDLKNRKTEQGKGIYSKRIQFSIQDVLDARSAGWSMKTFKTTAKTKDEIRREQAKDIAAQARGKEAANGEVLIAGARPKQLSGGGSPTSSGPSPSGGGPKRR